MNVVAADGYGIFIKRGQVKLWFMGKGTVRRDQKIFCWEDKL